MTIERTTIEEMRCSMGGCSNVVRDLGMREGEGVYTIEEIAIDAGWKIEELNGKVVHVCPRCSSDCDNLRAELARVKAESLRVVPIEQHELTHWEVAMVVFLNGATTIYERYDSDDGKLVRLERWEDER